MAGTTEGGHKSAATILSKYGKDYYKKLSIMGGKVTGIEKGYASLKVDKNGLTGPQRAKIYGSVAGQISRRKPKEGNKNETVGIKAKKRRSYQQTT